MSAINLHVEPNTPPEQWDDFVQLKPPFSVALDGYVYGATQFDEAGPRQNFNHHEEVDRLSTAATCEQVLTAIRSGFFQTFRENGLPRAEVFVNDCDQDVCTATYLLLNAPIVESATNPLVNALVTVESKLDATGGAYPFNPDLQIMRKIAWIFEPYTEFKNSGDINKRNAKDYEQVIEVCTGRIHDYVLGKGKEVPLDIRYEVLDQRNGYTVVREIGEHARLGMFAQGIDAFVSYKEMPDKKSWRYTLARRSQYVPFPVEQIAELLNKVDPLVDETNRWGGGNIFCGSPRATGSGISPDKLVELVDQQKAAKEL